jgi:hypothetical protein
VRVGVHALPLSLCLPSRAKLWCALWLRGQIHSPYFSSTPTCTLCCILSLSGATFPFCTPSPALGCVSCKPGESLVWLTLIILIIIWQGVDNEQRPICRSKPVPIRATGGDFNPRRQRIVITEWVRGDGYSISASWFCEGINCRSSEFIICMSEGTSIESI